MSWPRVASFKTPAAFRAHLETSRIPLDFDDALAPKGSSPLGQPIEADGVVVGNRWCILPMEGWDGTRDGEPSDLTRRRWARFGRSGAKLIWGGEAVAVRHDGRANPNQLLINDATLPSLAQLRQELVAAHVDRFGSEAGLFVGLQLTHSGRYARPDDHARQQPLAAYAHPVLDRRFREGVPLMSDDDLDRLVGDFVAAGKRAWDAGFAFVDVKHCHGYLGHELLSARDRPGRYGGTFENRTRFLREIVAGLRAEAPGLRIAARLSAFDTLPFRKGPDGVGQPDDAPADYHAAFGLTMGGDSASVDDARLFLRLLESLNIRWVCLTAGSPYWNPHVQRPALFPPTDGYLPPEDPLRGVARQIQATAQLKSEFPGMVIVGSAYSYLQEWLPHVAERAVRLAQVDSVGLGRMVLSYPDLPADHLEGRAFSRKHICRTFSDCTTAPRAGLVSGCYPLDDFYLKRPEAARLKAAKESDALVKITRDQGLAVATAFLSLFSIVGFALYGLPFFYDFFVVDLGWTRGQVTSGNAISKLVIGPVFGLLAGMVVDRFGPRRLMLFGIIIGGLALVGLGGVTTIGGFYFFYLLNALGYVCGGPLPNQVLLSRWFTAGRGKAMGLAYLGIGVGGTLVPLVAHALVEALGWRGALRVLGLLMIAVALPCAFFVRDPEASAASPAPSSSESLGSVLRTRAFYLLAIGSMCSIGAVGGTMQNLKLFLTLDRGFAQDSVAKLLSLILFGSLAGRLLFGWLADRWPKKRVMLLVYAVVAVTIPLFTLAPSIDALRGGAFLFGLGLGGDYMIIPLMAAELFGVKILGRLLGIVLTADGVAEAVAPMGVAWLRDSTGAYGSGFLLLVGLAAVGAIAIALLPSRGREGPASEPSSRK